MSAPHASTTHPRSTALPTQRSAGRAASSGPTPTRTPRLPLPAQLALAAVGVAALLVALVPVGLGPRGAVAGAAYAATLVLVLDVTARRTGVRSFGPAGAVTLTRAVLVGGVVALVVSDLSGATTVRWTLVGLAALALVLDGVDGAVARRTGTATAFGARLDMELDALTLLVLSAVVARGAGDWVLLIGLMRYLYVAAGLLLPWLVGELPVRRSAKVVAALQGVVLVVALAGVLPAAATTVLLVGALAALVWSFSSSVRHRWTHSDEHPIALRRTGSAVLTVAAAALVATALVVPHEITRLVPTALARVPAEGVVVAALLVVVPARARRVLAPVLGALLGLVALLALVDIGFDATLARPFDPVLDVPLFANGLDFLTETLGAAAGDAIAVVVALAALALVVVTALATRRLARLAADHRAATLRGVAVAAVTWLVALASGAAVAGGLPVAAADVVDGVHTRTVAVADGLRDRRAFAAEASHDAYAGTPPADLLAALRGKDVIVAVVESYGTTALADPGVQSVLSDGEAQLGAAGFAERTGELVSPVAGGGSWLAHATLYSGVRIDNEQRYRDLTTSTRLTLPRAFHDAGWDTCSVMPGTTKAWPEGAFYGVDRDWNDDRLGYTGPPFSWSPMPDQYALAQYQRLEHGRPGHAPQFCEVVLTSSHAPWTPLPREVPWGVADDPASYASMAGPQRSFDSVFGDPPAQVRANYLAATRYSLATLTSWIQRYGDPNTVLVVFGDHQPVPTVTGPDAPHTVPVSVIAHDPAVLDRIAGWGWAPGLRPAPAGPVWPMSAFRDRFFAAFGRS